jgi:hypothetical protein
VYREKSPVDENGNTFEKQVVLEGMQANEVGNRMNMGNYVIKRIICAQFNNSPVN